MALLLHYAGPAVNKIYKTLKINPPDADGVVKVDKYADVCKKITDYLNPIRNR